MWCDKLGLLVNTDKTGFVAFTRRRKLPGFFEPLLFWDDFALLNVSQLSWDSPGISADFEGTCGC
jgi:hypothetical protein